MLMRRYVFSVVVAGLLLAAPVWGQDAFPLASPCVVTWGTCFSAMSSVPSVVESKLGGRGAVLFRLYVDGKANVGVFMPPTAVPIPPGKHHLTLVFAAVWPLLAAGGNSIDTTKRLAELQRHPLYDAVVTLQKNDNFVVDISSAVAALTRRLNAMANPSIAPDTGSSASGTGSSASGTNQGPMTRPAPSNTCHVCGTQINPGVPNWDQR